MKQTVRIIWILSCIAVFLAMVYFTFAATAMFQKGIDFLTTMVFFLAWVPALFYLLISVRVLFGGWIPEGRPYQIFLLSGILILSLVFVTTLVRYSDKDGWIEDVVTRDHLQTTVDEKFEYRLELVNMEQRNATAQVYLKSIATGEEFTIPLDLPQRVMKGVVGGEKENKLIRGKLPLWSELVPTETENVYLLTTSKHFNKIYTYDFKIDVPSRTAELLQMDDKI